MAQDPGQGLGLEVMRRPRQGGCWTGAGVTVESGTMSLRDQEQGEASAGAAVEKVAEAYMGDGRGLESWRWQDFGKQACRGSRG